MANRQLPKGLNPLADDFETIIAVHQLAAELGLAPKVLAVDGDCQLMALADCGVARPIQPTDMPQIAKRAQQLQRAGIAWSKMIPKPSKTALREWSLLGDIATSCRPSAEQAQQLIVLGESAELSTLPVVPSHSDWNPGNWLHNGQRWWLIDWDFAGWRPALWDWASLVVEHDWSWEQAALWLSPPVIEQQRLLPWFCATLSLISSDWHRERGSNPATMMRAQQRSDYWLSVAEDQSMTNRTDRK